MSDRMFTHILNPLVASKYRCYDYNGYLHNRTSPTTRGIPEDCWVLGAIVAGLNSCPLSKGEARKLRRPMSLEELMTLDMLDPKFSFDKILWSPLETIVVVSEGE